MQTYYSGTYQQHGIAANLNKSLSNKLHIIFVSRKAVPRLASRTVLSFGYQFMLLSLDWT